jgi:hypothetical protein
MKKIIFIIMMLLGFGVNAQTMEKGYLNHLLDSQEMINRKFEMFPKAKKVIVRRRNVIVVFDRNYWEKMRLSNRGRRRFRSL